MAELKTEDRAQITLKRRIAQKIFNELEATLGHCLGEPIALAISGGADSRALLEAVSRWPLRRKSAFMVLTVDHHTRAHSASEAKAVHARALALGFDAEILSVIPGPKRDEASLRSARYEALWRALSARKMRFLCTAHQKDDNAEGVVMDLFGLGGGASGAGMKAENAFEDGLLLRPFLQIERRDLLLFLTSIGAVDYFEDPSNFDGSCARQKARDFLRHHGAQLHPAPIDRLSRVSQKRREEQDLLEPGVLGDVVMHPSMPAALLRRSLKAGYLGVCPGRDPRNAANSIDLIVKKAKSLGLIRSAGVDPRANSITLGAHARLSFDLPGAKALMTPGKLSLIRNPDDLLLQ